MSTETIHQAYVFLIFILNGIIIGIIFDIFRVLRKSFKTSNFMTYIEDIAFWIISGGILLYSIFVFNDGELRLYIFLGIILGIILYIITISKYFIKFNVTIINFFKGVIYKIFKIIFAPLNFIYKIIKKILRKPTLFIKTTIMSKISKLDLKIKMKKQETVKK